MRDNRIVDQIDLWQESLRSMTALSRLSALSLFGDDSDNAHHVDRLGDNVDEVDRFLQTFIHTYIHTYIQIYALI